MKHLSFPDGATRADLLSWYRAGRARSKEVFDLIKPEAYYTRPIALRNPVVFYEGHLPAFSVNTLIKLALGRPGVNADYEVLFARGIDPDDEASAKSPTDLWPSREKVQAYGAEADALIEDALLNARLEDEDVPQLRGAEAAFTILEHEQMHQETLLYMFHNLPYDLKVRRGPLGNGTGRIACPPLRGSASATIPAGEATLGATRGEHFGWDNEFPGHRVHVPEFTIDTDNVTNGEYLEYMQGTGAPAPHFWVRDQNKWAWRGMFDIAPLPLDAAVYVTQEEAEAYAKWRGKRLPSEAEWHRAAFGTPDGEERLYPWGNERPDATRGNFDFASWEPVPVGSHPEGASAWGVHDLYGNGWEWTSTIFGGFDGFAPMPSYSLYSADFFDQKHYVMKGASPATARDLVRRSFRNWFRPNYPYVYATFRCAQ